LDYKNYISMRSRYHKNPTCRRILMCFSVLKTGTTM